MEKGKINLFVKLRFFSKLALTLIWSFGCHFLEMIYFFRLMSYLFNLYPPVSTEEYTSEWMTKLLRAQNVIGKQNSVTDLQLTTLVSSGFLGDIVKVNVTYSHDDQDFPKSFVVKQSPNNFKGKMVTKMASLKREAEFYKHLLMPGRIDIKFPRCYYTSVRYSCQYHLLFQDLCHAKVEDTTREDWFLSETRDIDLEKSISVMAKIHATFWNKKELLNMGFFTIFAETEVGGAYFFATLIAKKAWAALESRNLWPKGWTFEDLEEILHFYPYIFKFLNTQPFTALHSDFRVGNILWAPTQDSSERDPYIIDWQNPRISHGMSDLSYHLSIDLPSEFRKEKEIEFIKFYLQKLAEYGVPEEYLDFQRNWTIYRISSLLNLIFFVMAQGIVIPEDQEKERQFALWTRRHSLTLLELDAISLGRDLVNGNIWTSQYANQIFPPTKSFC